MNIFFRESHNYAFMSSERNLTSIPKIIIIAVFHLKFLIIITTYTYDDKRLKINIKMPPYNSIYLNKIENTI